MNSAYNQSTSYTYESDKMATISTSSALSEYDKLVIETINEAIPSLERAVDYTSQTLVPAPLWCSLHDGERRVFGKALSHLVDLRLVPLIKTSPPYKMPITYQRI